MDGLSKIAENAGWWMPFDNVCFVSERHIKLKRDDQGRLHCADGPAVEYPDGWKIYAYHGILLNNPEIIENPASITVKQIESETNAEIKRILLNQYGWERYILDTDAQVISQDEFGTLYKKVIPGDEDLVMLQVVNSSKEGLWTKQGDEYVFHPAYDENNQEYRKKYMLRVPPTIKTAKEAVAWTFGLDPDRYTPILQS